MYVAHEARGRGVGRALLLAAIERARALSGVEQIHLAVTTHNSAARALYVSVGFVAYGMARSRIHSNLVTSLSTRT